MAIEMPNFFEAAGTFDGFDPSINADPIFSSNGVQPFNPATTPGAPLGGFTRIMTADYLIQLVRAIDVLESVSFVSCFPGIKPVDLCISVVPSIDDSGDGVVLVLGDITGEDAIFSMGVFRTKDNLDGTFGGVAVGP